MDFDENNQVHILRWLVSTNEYRFDPDKNLVLTDLNMLNLISD